MPILNDASVSYAIDVGGDEIDRLSLPLDLFEASGEMTSEVQVRDDTVAGHDHLLNVAAQVGDRGAHHFRGRQRSGDSLRASRRQRIVDEVRR